MGNNPLSNLSVSIKSVCNETNNFISYLDKNIFNLIFYPNIIEADLASDDYCKLLKSIKNYATDLPSIQDNTNIKEKINELPDIQEKEFKFYSSSIPIWILYIVFPIGIIIWINYYLKITRLIDRLRITSTKLGTIDFFLKAYIR
jgi:hypothetical protein